MPEISPLAGARQFFHGAGLDLRGHTIIVAVSGGPDSVCLLYVLDSLRHEFGFRLHIAHLNHCLRGTESDADAGAVVEIARNMGLPATVEKRDVPAFQRKNRLSMEEAARMVRYRFLEETAEAVGARYIATGHTADDRVETVLMNLLRGTGLRGLRGLLPVTRRRTFSGNEILLIRPLLDVSRAATEAYCRQYNLATRLDASNLSEIPLRNRVRHRLMPLLKSLNPGAIDSILRTARLAADDIDYIDTAVARLRPEILRMEKDAVVIDKPALLNLHPALRRYLLREAIKQLRGDLKDIEAAHIEDMVALLEKPAGKFISLPTGLWFGVEYGRYVLAAETASLCPLPLLDGLYPLIVPGTKEIPGWLVTTELLPSEGGIMTGRENTYTACLDAGIAGAELTVRSRRPGDRFIPLGMQAEKKLNRFMIDEHIPRSWRDRVPLLLAGDNIAWVIGYRIDERFKVTTATRRILRIFFKLQP